MDLTAQTFNRMASSEASMDHDTVRLTCDELLGVEVLPELMRPNEADITVRRVGNLQIGIHASAG